MVSGVPFWAGVSFGSFHPLPSSREHLSAQSKKGHSCVSGPIGATPTAPPWQKQLKTSPSVTAPAARAGGEAFAGVLGLGWAVRSLVFLRLWIENGVQAGFTALAGWEKLGPELLLPFPLGMCSEGFLIQIDLTTLISCIKTIF